MAKTFRQMVSEARSEVTVLSPQDAQQRMHEIRLPRVADLPLVLEGGEDVRPPQELDVGVGMGGSDLLYQVLEPDHQ